MDFYPKILHIKKMWVVGRAEISLMWFYAFSCAHNKNDRIFKQNQNRKGSSNSSLNFGSSNTSLQYRLIIHPDVSKRNMCTYDNIHTCMHAHTHLS